MKKPMSFSSTAMLICLFSYSNLTLAQSNENNLPTKIDFVNQQLAEQLLNQTKALSHPDLVKAQAQYFRSLNQALIDSGFSKEEALKIVIAIASQNK